MDRKIGAVLNFASYQIAIGDNVITLRSSKRQQAADKQSHPNVIATAKAGTPLQGDIRLYSKENLVIPPGSEIIIPLKASSRENRILQMREALAVPDSKFQQQHNVRADIAALIRTKNPVIAVINASEEAVRIKKM